jgi:hypothetical protein
MWLMSFQSVFFVIWENGASRDGTNPQKKTKPLDSYTENSYTVQCKSIYSEKILKGKIS